MLFIPFPFENLLKQVNMRLKRRLRMKKLVNKQKYKSIEPDNLFIFCINSLIDKFPDKEFELK